MTFGEFFRAGGVGMFQVTIFGLVMLAAAALFALAPDERRVPFLRAMSTATLLSIAAAVVSNFATVFFSVPTKFENQADWPRLLLIGSFESLTPAVLGFALLSFAWLIKAVGMRRLAMRLP